MQEGNMGQCTDNDWRGKRRNGIKEMEVQDRNRKGGNESPCLMLPSFHQLMSCTIWDNTMTTTGGKGRKEDEGDGVGG